jgi:putative ABC transport system permease protein
MGLRTRILNAFRTRHVNREIDEELASHLEEAIARGRDATEARRALGSMLRHREQSRDVRVLAWLDALRADAIFGWRQIRRNAVTSAAAVLSLALAIGGCTAAFRIIDALLWRPLPVAKPEQLYVLSRQSTYPTGTLHTFDAWEYPLFSSMRDAVSGDADLLAISYALPVDVFHAGAGDSDGNDEKATRQYVSGTMFASFGLQPALGRLLTPQDDRTPGAHPYAVISYDYWTRRFGQDPHAIGRTFRLDADIYEIIGVAPQSFTGTEPGTAVDLYVPMMMHPLVTRSDASWFRTLARVKPGVALEPLRDRLQAIAGAFHAQRAKDFTDMSQSHIAAFLAQKVLIEPAPTGVSGLQDETRPALLALGVLVLLVLLIACANVANLMTAQAAARAREMALRVSIGAGRARLMQLVLVESAWLAGLAAALGILFAWWSAPLVVGSINPADNPARLSLPADWRVLGFGIALTLVVTALLGLVPALRVSTVTPVSALKGGDDPHAHRRGMRLLIAGQVGFCVLVLFISGLFVVTFERLSHQPTGFSSERLLTLETIAQPARPAAFWDDVAAHVRQVPGVETVALADWPLLSGDSSNSFLSLNGGPPTDVLAFFLGVSPGWRDTMRIPLITGRDLRASDLSPGSAIVNEAFAKIFFNGENPVGRTFEKTYGQARFQIVGLVRDARYGGVREAILPVAYVPFTTRDAKNEPQPVGRATLFVRTSNPDPLALAPLLRREVTRARADFRVSTIRTQQALNDSHTVHERLFAMLALFFSAVALVLAGVGLYGVLHYAVLQRRREIGIRLAIGARGTDIVRRVTVDIFAMVIAGEIAGLALGLLSARYIESLLYAVNATDPLMLVVPLLTLLLVAVLAALPPAVRAVRINPVIALRTD